MRVLILTDSFNHCCGRSRHIVALADSMQQKGIYVSVVYASGDGAPMLAAKAIPFQCLPSLFHETRSIFGIVRAVIQIFNILRRQRFDIVHAHHRYASLLARIPSWLCKVPLIMTIHGTVKNLGILPAYAGDYYIAVSESVARFAVAETPRIAGRITAIPCGIPLSAETGNTGILRARWEIPMTAIVISIIGRLVDHKGHRIIFEALQRVKSSIPIITFVAGDGPAADAIARQAAMSPARTIFAGMVPDTSDVYAVTDIVAIPSLDFEGLPITLLEAGKYAKPVVVSDIAGMHDLIDNGVNGMSAQPGDVAGFASALQKLVDDAQLRRRLGEQLHALVSGRFSDERMTADTIGLYGKLSRAGRRHD